MKNENEDKVSFFSVWAFSGFSLLTSVFPLELGGVICVAIWMAPALLMDRVWVKEKIKVFPLMVCVTWLVAIVVGGFLSGTALDYNPLD